MSEVVGSSILAVVVDREPSGGIIAEARRIPTPSAAGPGELLVHPAFIGLCGSDLEQLHGSMPESFRIRFPHVLGHEWSGTVLQAGDDTGFEVGDQIVGHGSLGDNRWFGVTTDGAMAEQFLVPAAMCFPVPDGVTLRAAAVIEPLVCVFTAFTKLPWLSAADRANVFGLGAIGLSAVAMLASMGVEVHAIDPSPLRRELAVALGATSAVAPESPAIAPADLTIDASGVAAAQAAAFDSADVGATVLYLGVSRPREVPVRLGLIQERDLRLLSSTGADPRLWPKALRFLERTGIDLELLVTSVLPFEAIDEAIGRAQRPDDDVKVLLTSDRVGAS